MEPVFWISAANAAWAAGGLMDESSAMTAWSFAGFLLLVLLMVAVSVVVRALFLPRQPDKKKKRPAPQAEKKSKTLALPETRQNLKALPAGSGKHSVASIKRSVASHAAEVAQLKAWCEQQDPDRAVSVLKSWIKKDLEATG